MSQQPIAVTSYCDINGRRHQHSQVIRVSEEQRQLGVAEQKRREVAVAVQNFRDEHHHNVVADAGNTQSSLSIEFRPGPCMERLFRLRGCFGLALEQAVSA